MIMENNNTRTDNKKATGTSTDKKMATSMEMKMVASKTKTMGTRGRITVMKLNKIKTTETWSVQTRPDDRPEEREKV